MKKCSCVQFHFNFHWKLQFVQFSWKIFINVISIFNFLHTIWLCVGDGKFKLKFCNFKWIIICLDQLIISNYLYYFLEFSNWKFYRFFPTETSRNAFLWWIKKLENSFILNKFLIIGENIKNSFIYGEIIDFFLISIFT